ncbi:UNKNOWN [Stylonychia lemnae]|uniref:Uncharacterized protein n=1 Tax=Stylonychia lemnae TaxID=5949 RepID=A0A078B9H4_STYLE|nr:UNKNOWN [Stylonychia lemnae]|eukprot:CDW91180.1 UNKNOWN [Stylonychia lemnae]
MQAAEQKIVKIGIIIEFNQYSRHSQVSSITDSYENGDILQQFLLKQQFRVDRINHGTQLQSPMKFIDLLDNLFDEHLEHVRAIENHVCFFVYARCQSIVPKGSEVIEIFDPNGYRFQIEKRIKQFADMKNCATYIYLECPRSNPKNLPQSKKVIEQIDLDQAQGLLLIQYCFAQGQSWDNEQDQSRKDKFKSFVENLRDFKLVDFMDFFKNFPNTSIIGRSDLKIVFDKCLIQRPFQEAIQQNIEMVIPEKVVKQSLNLIFQQQQVPANDQILQLQEEIKLLKSQLNESEQNNQKLVEQLESIKTEKDIQIDSYVQRIKILENDLEVKSQEIQNNSREQSKHKMSIQSDNSQMEKTIKKLEKKNEKLNQKVKDYKQKIKSDKEDYQKRIADIQDNILKKLNFNGGITEGQDHQTIHHDVSFIQRHSTMKQVREQSNQSNGNISNLDKSRDEDSLNLMNRQQVIRGRQFEEKKFGHQIQNKNEENFNLFERIKSSNQNSDAQQIIINRIAKANSTSARSNEFLQDKEEFKRDFEQQLFKEFQQKQKQEEEDRMLAKFLHEEERKQIEQNRQQQFKTQEEKNIHSNPRDDHNQSLITLPIDIKGLEVSQIIKEEETDMIKTQLKQQATFQKLYDNEADQNFDKLTKVLEGKKNLIFLVRAKNSQGIIVGRFGVYISIEYKAQEEKSYKDSQAFIFSIDKKMILEQIDPFQNNVSFGPSKIISLGSQIVFNKKAIHQQLDLVLIKNSEVKKCTNNIGQSFQLPNGENPKILTSCPMFQIERLEVFQMIN